MWTSTLNLSRSRTVTTRLLSLVWPGAYYSSFAPLRVQNLPRQALPAQNWVRVRNKLAGISGGDLHAIHLDADLEVASAALPKQKRRYPGHEVVGEVIEVGDSVERLRVGDRVVLQQGASCLSAGVQPACRSCASGNYSLCENAALPGPQAIGGGWSEEMLLHECQLFCIASTMTNEQAVLLEPSSVALHAVLRNMPQSGQQVLIIGAGTIGLLTVQIVHALVPDAEISVLARYPFQVEQATRLGAAHIIYPEDSYSGVQQATGAKLYTGSKGNQVLLGGYDVIYDTVGDKDTLHHALRWACARATLVVIGLSLHRMELDLTPIWYREINLVGSVGHGMENWPAGPIGATERRSSFEIASEMILQGQIHPERLLTHRFSLIDYRHALVTADGKDRERSRAIKVVFDYSRLPASATPNAHASARKQRHTLPDVQQIRPVVSPSPGTMTPLPVTPPVPRVPTEPLVYSNNGDAPSVVSRESTYAWAAEQPPNG